MLDCDQFRKFILVPALRDINLLSKDAVELMLFTVAAESRGGTYIHQAKGPALGIYQMEPTTYNDIWQNYIKNQSSYMMNMLYNFHAPTMPDEDRLIYDMRFATVMARLHYRRVSENLPNANDLEGIWSYYKRYYNTFNGKAEHDQCISLYRRFIGNG